jgi:hypothetical protein
MEGGAVRGEDLNVKDYDVRRTTTDAKSWQDHMRYGSTASSKQPYFCQIINKI